jgi:thioredoxin reductase (NADPH)
VVWNTVIDDVLGTEDPLGVTGLRLRDCDTNAVRNVNFDGVFIAIGHAPASELFTGQLPTKEGGYCR